MAGLDTIVDNPITNNPSLRQATILLTKNPFVIGEQLVRTFNLQNVRVLTAPQVQYDIASNSRPPEWPADQPLYTSALGTPVMADLTFEADSYIDEAGQTQYFDQVRFETVLITIDQSVNIVKTAIQGRAGTVKEYISVNDYSVTINALLVGSYGHYPAEQVLNLKHMLVAPVAKRVTSSYLQLWDIFSLTIEGWNLEQIEGGYSVQPVTINCSSDADVKLRLL